jgi:hypothetical protein
LEAVHVDVDAKQGFVSLIDVRNLAILLGENE